MVGVQPNSALGAPRIIPFPPSPPTPRGYEATRVFRQQPWGVGAFSADWYDRCELVASQWRAIPCNDRGITGRSLVPAVRTLRPNQCGAALRTPLLAFFSEVIMMLPSLVDKHLLILIRHGVFVGMPRDNLKSLAADMGSGRPVVCDEWIWP